MLTKEKIIRIQTSRGYEVKDLGKIVIFRMNDYSATWFFNSDGTVDETKKPLWTMKKPN